MDLQPDLDAADSVKPMINVGAGFDIPTGFIEVGEFGERIINGGVGQLTGIVGQGNVFKSTEMDHQMLTAQSRMEGSNSLVYDTEQNKHEHRTRTLCSHIDEFYGEDLFLSGRYRITDKSKYTGDQFYDKMKEFMQNKIKNRDKLLVETPFYQGGRKEFVKIPKPNFIAIDSFSEFSTADVIKMQDDNSLGESGGNMIFMRQGIQKNRLLMEVPGLAGASGCWWFFTGHIGDEFLQDPRKPPEKKMTDMKQGKKFKGLPEKFTFLTNNCWYGQKTERMITDKKEVEYPRNSDDDMTGDTDLNLVTFRQLRGKSGPSGVPMNVVISQSEGVLPSLTEFRFIKEADRWGLEGNMVNYTLALCPDIKLARHTVRGKIEDNAALRRGLLICSEMRQIFDLWHYIREELRCTPKQLFDDLIALGYDWDEILNNTRGWWALRGTKQHLHFLSTIDLLRMRRGMYIPYWMETPPDAALKLYNERHETPWQHGVAQLEEVKA